MTTLSLPVGDVAFGDRIRDVDPAWAEVLADSMALHGQMTPIAVRETPGSERPYALVAGAHRLRALELLGKDAVDATVFDGDALAARLREIEENLIRHELTVLDRAAFVAEQKSLYEALHPETKHGDINRIAASGQVGHLGATRFTKVAAERVGLGERTLRRLAKLHSGLNPAIRKQVSGTWLANNGQQLGHLADLPKGEQPAIVEALFGDTESDGDRPKTVHEAIDRVRGVHELPANKDDEAAERILALWRKASPKAKRAVAQRIHPDIAKIMQGDKS